MSVSLKPVTAWNLGTPANGATMYRDTIKPLKENIESVAAQVDKCVQVEPQNFTKAEKDQARKNLEADNGRIHRFCLYWSDIPYGVDSAGNQLYYCLLGDMEQLNEEGTDVLPVTKERLYEIYKNNEVLSFTSYVYSNREKHWGIASDVDIYFQDEHEGDFDYLSVSISFSLPVQFHSMRYPERYTCHNFTFGPNNEKSPYIAVYGPNASGHSSSVGIYSMTIPDKSEVIPVFTSNPINKGSIDYDEDTGEYFCRIENYAYNEIITPDSMTTPGGVFVQEPTLVCYCDMPNEHQNILTFIDLKVNFAASWHAPIKLKIIKRYPEWRSSQVETYTVELHSQYTGTFKNGKTYTILAVGGSKSGGIGGLDLPNGAWFCLDCSQERKVHNLLYGIQDDNHTSVPYLTDLDRFRTASGDKKYKCYVTAEEVIKWHAAGDEIVLHYAYDPTNYDNTFMLRLFQDQSSGNSKACRLEFVSFLYGTVIQQINFITNNDGYLYVSEFGNSDFEQHKFAYTSGVISDISDGVASVINHSFETLTIPATFSGDLTIVVTSTYNDAVNCDILITSNAACDVFVRTEQGSVYDMLWTDDNAIAADKKYLLSVRGNCCSLKEAVALQQPSTPSENE